ncbi:MAG: deoxyguanosinetriphosphate triphosphohydrolase [Defluviitaleaceae bacterium]|nr:deoxyguanosinetriphosphate triphosphohydrolase [Defluviitaleaceae bacterium]
MTIREHKEQREQAYLSPYAAKSINSAGRKLPSEKCDLRTEYQKDRDRITHCKAFRRLKHKTQVFISPEGDHYRTRLTHTLEVAQIARTIASALSLNEDLTEAIALGHDMGHTPFGHTGEDALDTLLPGGFRHNEQSARVVEHLENEGRGLNLTAEVIDGILNHRTSCNPSTLEGHVVRISDKIAYTNHDLDDALRAKILSSADFPEYINETLGKTPSQRIDFMVKNLVENSLNKPEISFSLDVAKITNELRLFLTENVYANMLLHHRERNKIQTMLRLLFEYYSENPQKLPPELTARMDNNPTQTVADYIAGMTDRFAMNSFSDIFIPEAWN